MFCGIGRDDAGGSGNIHSQLMGVDCFRPQCVNVRSGLEIGHIQDRPGAGCSADHDICLLCRIFCASNRFHLEAKLRLHVLGKGCTMPRIATINIGLSDWPNGRCGSQLHAGLKSASYQTNDFGVRRTEVPDGHATDSACSDGSETLAYDDALEPGIVGRPNRDDLGLFVPGEGVVDTEASERPVTGYTAYREDQISVAVEGA